MTRHSRGRGRAGRRAECGARAADMRIHTGLADPEELGDLFRREAACDGAQHLTLTIRQRRDRAGTARKDAPR